ncbi:nucleotide exchange factor GrpE [Candidatus Dependentiae bacterium]
MSNKDKNDKKRENEKKGKENINQVDTDELVRIREQLLRVNADFQNFKKRTEKEKTEWISVGQSIILEKFLSFIDDLNLAIKSVKDQGKNQIKESWIEGFLIIQKKNKKIFSDLGVKEIDCSKIFNPEYHEALMQVDSKKHKTGEIVQVFNKGYLFKDKVLRHAKVSVAK